jgi:hypothetical protein
MIRVIRHDLIYENFLNTTNYYIQVNNKFEDRIYKFYINNQYKSYYKKLELSVNEIDRKPYKIIKNSDTSIPKIEWLYILLDCRKITIVFFNWEK